MVTEETPQVAFGHRLSVRLSLAGGVFGVVIFIVTIDHIEPIRRIDRSGAHSGYAMCMRLRKAGFPAGYQILCFNCNHAKGTKIECPHRRMLMNRILEFRPAAKATG